MNGELERCGRGLIEVIFRNFNGETEENYKNFFQDIGFPCRDSNGELILAQFVKKFPVLYATCKFINQFTKIRHSTYPEQHHGTDLVFRKKK
jgi:hypothetical protein